MNKRNSPERLRPVGDHHRGDWLALCITPSLVHVYPDSDLITHDIGPGGCICGPEVTSVDRADGAKGQVVTHASLDGRELTE